MHDGDNVILNKQETLIPVSSCRNWPTLLSFLFFFFSFLFLRFLYIDLQTLRAPIFIHYTINPLALFSRASTCETNTILTDAFIFG